MEFIFDVCFHDDLPGNAGADIRMDIPSGILAVLYWADAAGQPLADHLPIKALALTGGKGTYALRDGLLIPEAAEMLLCKVYNDCMLEIVLPELRVVIPEHKLLPHRRPLHVIYATSDIHYGGHYFHNDANRAAAFAHMAKDAPDFVMITGDITDNSYPEEYAAARADIEACFQGIPVIVCAGNHDYSPYKPGATPHFKEMHDFFLWQCERNRALGVTDADLGDKNFFEARFADGTQILVLNANDVKNHFEVGAQQRAWLDRKLTESDGARYRFVMSHYHQQNTVGCSQRRMGQKFFIDNNETQEILDRHQNVLHISGHTHYNFDSDMPNTFFDSIHRNLYLNAGCAVWNGVDMEERREYYLQNRATGQRIEIYEDCILTRGVDFVSGRYIPRCLHYAGM